MGAGRLLGEPVIVVGRRWAVQCLYHGDVLYTRRYWLRRTAVRHLRRLLPPDTEYLAHLGGPYSGYRLARRYDTEGFYTPVKPW